MQRRKCFAPDGKYVVCTLTDESEIEAWEARELISGAAKWEG